MKALELIFEDVILALYGKDIDKIHFLKDKASSVSFAKKKSEIIIKFILFIDIPVKSPHVSAMDFYLWLL